jgi:hypothetical protein
MNSIQEEILAIQSRLQEVLDKADDSEFQRAVEQEDREAMLKAIRNLKREILQAVSEKKIHQVEVGEVYFDSDTGHKQEEQLRSVQFEGEKLAETDWNPSLQNSGHCRTLFLVDREEGQFVVHDVFSSQWQGTNSRYKIMGPFTAEEVSDKWPDLASKAGIEVPKSLDKALA